VLSGTSGKIFTQKWIAFCSTNPKRTLQFSFQGGFVPESIPVGQLPCANCHSERFAKSAFVFGVDFLFFLSESICTRECPLELSFSNSPGQISICNDLVSLRKSLKDFPRFSPGCNCTIKDFVNVARFAYLAKGLYIYRGTSLIRDSAPPRTLRYDQDWTLTVIRLVFEKVLACSQGT